MLASVKPKASGPQKDKKCHSEVQWIYSTTKFLLKFHIGKCILFLRPYANIREIELEGCPFFSVMLIN